MIKQLLSLRLRAVLSGTVGGKKKRSDKGVSKGKIILISLVYLYVLLIFGGMFCGLAILTAPLMIAAGLDWFYFAIFNVIAFALVFIFSIFETKSELFECKDNELLLSMPIRPRDIILSRILTVLVYNYLEAAIVLLPCIICYAIFGGGALGIIGSTLTFLLIPLLATALASAVGYLVALLSKKFKRNSFITLAVSLVFLFLYLWGYTAFTSMLESEEGAPDFVAMGESFSGLSFIGEASMLHPVYTPLMALLSVGAAFVAYAVISGSYISIVTDNSVGKRKKYKEKKAKQLSAFSALSKNEYSRFFSSATYMLNGGLGIIFVVIAAVFALIKKNEINELFLLLSEGFSGMDTVGAISAFGVAALGMISSLNLISASALSLEGKRFWITKTMPVSAKAILLSKMMPALTLPVLPNLFASVAVIIVARADILSALMVILIPFAMNLFAALIGIVFNGLFPKFSYQNEAEVIKQSLASFLSMLVLMLSGLVLIGIAIVFSFVLMMPRLGMLLTLLMLLILSLILFFVILGPISRKYEKYSL